MKLKENEFLRAAILDRSGNVIGEAFDVPAGVRSIDIAGDFTIDQDPVNVRTYKISRSKVNLGRACFEQPASKIGDVWTWLCVQNGRVTWSTSGED